MGEKKHAYFAFSFDLYRVSNKTSLCHSCNNLRNRQDKIIITMKGLDTVESLLAGAARESVKFGGWLQLILVKKSSSTV